MAGDKTATYTVKIDVESNAPREGDSLATLQSRITKLQDAVKHYTATNRLLRGSSDEVKTAKKNLTDQTNRLKDAISQNANALVKQGGVFRRTRDDANDTDSSFKQFFATIVAGVASGELLVDAFKSITEFAGRMLGKVVDLGTEFAKFTIEAAGAKRENLLLAEALTGSAEGAKNFEDHNRALANSIPTSVDEIRKLHTELFQAFQGSFVSGQGVVNALNAIGQTASAVGPKAAGIIQNIFERGKNTGRLGIASTGLRDAAGRVADELQGTGINRDDVATQLAKRLGIGIDKARLQLATGRVKIDDGIAAIRSAVEARFGEINTKRLDSLDVQITKLKDNLKNIAATFKIDTLIATLITLTDLFRGDTIEVQALKEIFKDLGHIVDNVAAAFGIKLAGGADATKTVVDKLLGSLLTVSDKIVDITGDLGIYIQLLKDIYGATLGPVINLISSLLSVGLDVAKGFTEIGVAIVDGIFNGFTGTFDKLKNAVKNMATEIKDDFKALLGIHSPSAVFEEYGRMTSSGFEKGVAGGVPRVNDTVGKLGAPAIGVGNGGTSLAGGGSTINGVTVNVHAAFPNAKDGREVAASLTSPSFRAQLTKAVEEMLLGAAVPTQTPAAGVT